MIFWVIAIGAIALAVGIGLGWFVGSGRRGFIGGMVAVIFGATTLGLFIELENARGYDGILHLALLIVIMAPLGGGLLIGALTGWLKQDDNDTAHLA